ncbi:DNA internalization-related competence protein ComEC/Rec2 [Xenophilus arseniciresistens]|uniref:DNA internalization-related competence protein ComEC/Rec2 n=1 Tax=Xenophilus arseniciresistens TaxID=1283306 RepID=A0AAE3N7M5_9BURK|nr:DNA internalization-related competence protein ComEC/Rec2 [Xenophilus arseniciresistens]MDA7416373.1 DNA internalization-related competence protein ComEC/Rec2 [Xenophilus arseniciresistens]
MTQTRLQPGHGPAGGGLRAPPAGARGRGATAAFFFALLAGSLAGTAVQLQQPRLWPLWAYGALALAGGSLVLLLVLGRGSKPARSLLVALALALALAAGALLGAAQTGLRAAHFEARALAPALEGRDLLVSGVVAQMPQRHDTGLRFEFELESVRLLPAEGGAGPGTPVDTPARVALSWYAEGSWAQSPTPLPAAQQPAVALHAGERWQFIVRLKAPHGSRNPHGFDHELWLWEQGVQATGHVRSADRRAPPSSAGQTWRHPVERAREAVRDAILARAQAMPEDPARARALGVVAALVTGDQAAIERADWDVFRTTGVAHLMSISGLHITMLAWLAAALVGLLWRRSSALMLWRPAPQAALAGGVLLAAAYALFSGWGVPAQRTVCMLALVTLLRSGARQWPWPFVWLTVCAAVTALDPWALLQPGFWLSFVAVGVLFASDAGRVAAPHELQPGTARRLGRQALRLLREQGVVTVALTPLSLLLFQQVSVVGFVANLAAIPWVTLVVTPLAMLGLALPVLWDAAALAVRALGTALAWLAAWPLATWSVAAAPLWAGVAGVLGGLLLAMRLPWALRLWGLPLMLPVLLWQPLRPPEGEFDLLAADVGQGNALLLRTARHSLVYDAGPRYSLESDAGHRVLVPLLRALGERPDILVLSHRDSDHTGGTAALLATQPQMQVLGSLEPGHPLQALRPATRCEAGQRWEWDGVRFELLHPQPFDYAHLGARPNTLSCVLRVSNGRAAVLLAGDIERLQELALVWRSQEAGRPLHADLLLVPHHGSKTSSSDALLEAVAPRLALVQAGWRNRFGHPAPEVVARYRARSIVLADTPHCGAARWRSGQPQALQCERQQAPRYWQHRPAAAAGPP